MDARLNAGTEMHEWASNAKFDTSVGPAVGVEHILAGERLPRFNQALAARRVMTGWGYRSRSLSNGRRQIFGFILPGDRVGVGRHDRPLDLAEAYALTEMRLSLCDASDPASTASILKEDHRLLDQIVRLGRQSAWERLMHLMLELSERLERVGHAKDGVFELPLTQEVLGDALGLSVVHVNRTLQRLRQERLIELHQGRIKLLDRERMKRACDYSNAERDVLIETMHSDASAPTYL